MWLPTSSATTSSTRGLLAHVVRGRFRPDQVNAAAVARYDTRTPEQLLALLTDHLQPCGLPAAPLGPAPASTTEARAVSGGAV
jgi:hypothetical protein